MTWWRRQAPLPRTKPVVMEMSDTPAPTGRSPRGPDMLATPLRRRVLFFCLYLSEGAPIGYLWLAIPARLRLADVPLAEITALTAALVLPWTFKFAWAPAVDLLQGRRWGLRHWILAAQSLMGATLLPLAFLDLHADFAAIGTLLMLHAFAAATQDVAIDALCIRHTAAEERGRLNAWMQAGMMSGRAAMGGGALLLGSWIGDRPVVFVLVVWTTFSMLLVAGARERRAAPPSAPAEVGAGAVAVPGEHTWWASLGVSGRSLLAAMREALATPAARRGFLFALFGGAAFKAFEVVLGPFLVDRGWSREAVGSLAAGPMIFAMICGAVVGGRLADRYGHRRMTATALVAVVASVAAVAVADLASAGAGPPAWMIVGCALAIGLFTTSSYALLMDIVDPRAAATQFSAFMGATNGCEAWSVWALGHMAVGLDYSGGLMVLCLVSLAALALLPGMEPARKGG